ncbi:MAG: hypothetical protein HYX21_00845 [Candidatus Yanofskybacteria bacterium]|nr:hypothetical protein [Candidatus Yanofskybacteria bacterium]
MIKKILLIFASAFLLNLVWENLHSLLYLHYKSGAISELILLRATLFDAVFISILGILFLKFSYLKNRLWLSLPFGFAIAIVIELYALKTGRWAYGELMPVVPFINTGVTPTIQLGLLSYLIFKWFVKKA